MALSDRMTRRIEQWSEEVLREMGRDGVKLIRQLAGVRVTGIGDFKIRSEPGEPPRRDKSTLWLSIKYRIQRGPGKSADLIFYSTDRSIKVSTLEFGGDHMEARPLWGPAKRQMGDTKRIFKQRLAQKIKDFHADPFNSLGSLYQD